MNDILHIINQMSPYLLLGFLLAGVVHAFIPSSFYKRHFSSPTFGSVVKSALFGIPLPLCSCGVIPTAMSLRKEGASKGATTSFLIATPQTGVDSIIATYGLLGLPFAVVRPLAALCTALLGGSLSNLFDKSAEKESSSRNQVSADAPSPIGMKIVTVLKYAFYEMIQNIGKWLVVGLLIAGLITIFVPDEWFTLLKGNTLASMALVLAISVPMYLCATGSIPIAVALMMKGLTPGAALVLLMAGPACNMASILVVKSVMGTKSVCIYLVSLIIGAVAFGCLIDYLQYHQIVDFLSQIGGGYSGPCCHHHDSWFSWTCSGALLLLLANAFILPKLKNKQHNTSTMNSSKYHIEGMNCTHCRAAAEKALQNVEGVTSAHVELETKEAIIEGTASEESLRKAIEEVGFKLLR